MANYLKATSENWIGRTSGDQLYLHEKIELLTPEQTPAGRHFSILGYACDEGVRRNQGRVGAANGPNSIRKMLGKMPNHLSESQKVYDFGDIQCDDGNMEACQELLSKTIGSLLDKGTFPIVLGGGHDVAYGHYNGIKQHLLSSNKLPSIGIINFDAHFDLRDDSFGSNSGTPFYQIANENEPFHYLCLGIRKDANDKKLFETAASLDVTYVMQNTFRIEFMNEIKTWIKAFLKKVNHVYVTIDMDGFSSAYAPGSSAASPMGFAPDIVLECLDTIISSEKLISVDIAEMNPVYDSDHQTAKLAASLVHHIIHRIMP
ncbi:formimidoylglutamase [Croceivirga thetidis]|uniref:Formimidoylglutamase n=1 Tax=Croceivirga thetidis TaxID=2721623 RepID=A0ABX1GLK7_9FLAO|nr:formimidoylglutamase [Croceivirga thetidis]NKI30744.1 formimidoylglutamase [Croceivirga thetidis]